MSDMEAQTLQDLNVQRRNIMQDAQQGLRQDYQGELDHFERYARPATASGTPRRGGEGSAPGDDLMCRLMEKVLLD